MIRQTSGKAKAGHPLLWRGAALRGVLRAAVRLVAGEAPAPAAAISPASVPKDAWPALWQLAERLEIGPALASWTLASHAPGVPRVSTTWRQEATSYRFANTARNVLLGREHRRVLAALARERLPALPLKGPLLAQRCFGDVGARSIVDLDILVPARSAAEAAAVLLRLGYVLPSGVVPADLPLPERRDVALIQTAERAGAGVTLELHWKVKDTLFPMPLSTFWSGRVGARWAGETLETLDPTSEVLYLLQHLTVHAFALKNLLDLWMAIRTHADRTHADRIDWDRLLRDCREARLERALGVALDSMADVLGVNLPAGALAARTRLGRRGRVAARALHRVDWYFGEVGLRVQCDGRLRAIFGRLIVDRGNPTPRRARRALVLDPTAS